MAMAALRKADEDYPSLFTIFDRGIVWTLEHMDVLPGVSVPGTPLFAFEHDAWKAFGIPAFRIAYTLSGLDLEIVHFSFLGS